MVATNLADPGPSETMNGPCGTVLLTAVATASAQSLRLAGVRLSGIGTPTRAFGQELPRRRFFIMLRQFEEDGPQPVLTDWQ